MIWHYLHLGFLFLARLILPLPASATARIRIDSPCPACGAHSGSIRTVDRGGVILVQHTCAVCAARYHESPIVKVTPEMVWPGIPRTELELKEEYSANNMKPVLGPRPQPVKPIEVRHPPANMEPAQPVITSVQPQPPVPVDQPSDTGPSRPAA